MDWLGSRTDGATRAQAAVILGILDHGERNAVLDRAAGILALQLDEKPACTCVEAVEFDDWRLADQVENGAIRQPQAAAVPNWPDSLSGLFGKIVIPGSRRALASVLLAGENGAVATPSFRCLSIDSRRKRSSFPGIF